MVFADVATTIAGMNTKPVRTVPRSPWQNAYVERVIGSIRRECLDHAIVMNAAGLREILTERVAVANPSGTRQGCTDLTPSQAAVSRTYHRDAASWWAPPSLRARSVITSNLHHTSGLVALPSSFTPSSVTHRTLKHTWSRAA
jgi:hypothetical protein